MNRRERLMATLHGQPVDRPPVSFYELNGLDERPDSEDPFNIYSHPSWTPLIELTGEKTDRIVMRYVPLKNVPPGRLGEITTTQTYWENGSFFTRTSAKIGGHTLTSTTRRDPDVNTVWQVEPLLKDLTDLKAWLELPAAEFRGEPDVSAVLRAEKELGDTGIVMLDTPDPLCQAASLFDLAEFTLIATIEQKLFHQLLERFASLLQPRTEAIARALPGRLWRIYGPEYGSPPYLRPSLFREYVVRYDTPMIDVIQSWGGFARIHSHGRLKDILDDIVSMGCMGLDPVEPPPQGDVELGYVRGKYGRQLVLFGNLEASDIENLSAMEFEKKVHQALREGTQGEGRGFVLMPSACPYGRQLSPLALANYRKIIEVVERWEDG